MLLVWGAPHLQLARRRMSASTNLEKRLNFRIEMAHSLPWRSWLGGAVGGFMATAALWAVSNGQFAGAAALAFGAVTLTIVSWWIVETDRLPRADRMRPIENPADQWEREYRAWCDQQACDGCGLKFKDRPRTMSGEYADTWMTETQCETCYNAGRGNINAREKYLADNPHSLWSN